MVEAKVDKGLDRNWISEEGRQKYLEQDVFYVYVCMDLCTCVQMHLYINEIKIYPPSSRGISGIQKTQNSTMIGI